MNFNFIKKLKDKIKKPKKFETIEEVKTLSNKEFSVSSPEPIQYVFTTTQSENSTNEVTPIIDPEKLCNNCQIEMKEKTFGINHKNKTKKHRKVLLCSKCGFEKRLAR